MFEHREMTDAELHERLNQISVTVQRIRFQDGREAHYHAKRWASEQNKPIRQELKRRLQAASSPSLVASGAGLGNSAPEADLLDYQREGSDEDEDRRALMSEFRPIGGC
jgi:uncharacterized protein YPO0396